MYSKRIKFFIILSIFFLAICLVRLTQMQLCSTFYYQQRVEDLKTRNGRSLLLGTLRGSILDRNGRELAVDDAQFQLNLSYQLTCVMDARLVRAEMIAAEKKEDPAAAQQDVKDWVKEKWTDLDRVIEKCCQFGYDRQNIEDRITKMNDRIWTDRVFHAWRNLDVSPEFIEKYGSIISIPLSEAVADFEKRIPDEAQRLNLIRKADIAEMKQSTKLIDLETDDDIFTAQFEFLDTEGVEVTAKVLRVHPYATAASQTIGWVGKAETETIIFEDELKYYLPGEVCGKQPGIEYICEELLRGKRGKLIYDIDNKLIEKTETQLGQDVRLTLDIELQREIEETLSDPLRNPFNHLPTAAVVLDVKTGQILSMVSLPNFNLNSVRYDYGKYINDPNHPMINRAINGLYPPGSIIKPIILASALESKKIGATETISCPYQRAPTGWPNCLSYTRSYSSCHDWQWDYQGGNNGRNAIRGSCNIYFSRLADRFEPKLLQGWLWRFGMGHPLELGPSGFERKLRQADGIISSTIPSGDIQNFNNVPALRSGEKRYFGIGQGNLRATPLQLVNAIAVFARNGIYKPVTLFIENDAKPQKPVQIVSPASVVVVRDGMRAVINEQGGTANSRFSNSDFNKQGIKVYGKTGSTQAPEHAWFAGFAEGANESSVAIIVLVEKGQSGSGYAAPLGRAILEICVNQGYLIPNN